MYDLKLLDFPLNEEKKEELDQGVSVEELIQKIQDDKKINGEDLIYVKGLMDRFKKDKEGILKNTKINMRNTLIESLKKGYSVENVKDYEIIYRIMALINENAILPSYSQVLYHLVKNYDLGYPFSIEYIDGTLRLYQGVQVGYINLDNGDIIIDGSLFKYDRNGNNNNFNMNI